MEFFNLITRQLQSRKDERDCENGLLFNSYYYYLLKIKGIVSDLVTRSWCMGALNLAKDKKCGIFHSMPSEYLDLLHKPDQYISHDTITGIVCMNNKEHNKVIWKEIKRQWFRYNDQEIPITFKQKLTNKRFLHPRDIIFYGHKAGSIICTLLLPILSFFMILSCIEKYKTRGGRKILKTDGKLLTWLRCNSSNFKITYIICTLIIKHFTIFKTWDNVFLHYFNEEGHPIREICKNT